jgi:two-component system, OmpR family, response regulator ChvI
MATLALVDDDKEANDAFAAVLQAAGHETHQFFDRKTAEIGLKARKFDAVLLDLQMQGDDVAGIGVFSGLPPPPNRPPVLVISGLRDVAIFRPLTLELGVWDYLPKPVDNKSLLLKVDRLLRETRNAIDHAESVGSLQWRSSYPGQVEWRKHKVRLPNTAYRLLLRLAKSAGRSVTYAELFELLDTGKTKENLRAHIKVIRDEILAVDPDFEAIRPEPGRGYIWHE